MQFQDSIFYVKTLSMERGKIMPYASEKKKLPRDADRRRKLSDKDKDQIREDHKGGESIRSISRRYKVDRRTIDFLLFPEKLEENVKRLKERGGWALYYDKTKHAESMKNHRRYKNKFFKSLIK